MYNYVTNLNLNYTLNAPSTNQRLALLRSLSWSMAYITRCLLGFPSLQPTVISETSRSSGTWSHSILNLRLSGCLGPSKS